MDNSRFQLSEVSKEKSRPHRRAVGASLRVGATVALVALTLVLGALFGPLLLHTESAAAVQPSRSAALTVAVDPQAALQQDALADLFDAIVPSVVSIETAGELNVADLPEGFPQDQLPEGLVPQGQGSGWIFDNDGHIVTNNHVVEGAQRVTVIFYDGTWADAEVVASDPQADLAVLRVDPPAGLDWQPLVLAGEGSLRVGHSVIALGNPFGYESTMTTGIVSALGRSFPVGEMGESRYSLPDVIQTDAAINPGNSGGPLLNLAGELVGVNFAIESTVRANSGVGFAIPVSIVERVVPALIAEGRFVYPYLGLSGTSVTPSLAREFGLSNTQLGAYVATVIPGGPAAQAGIRPGNAETGAGGDIVVSFNGRKVDSFDSLVAALITTSSPGDTVTLGVVRDGELIDVQLVVGERPAQVAARTTEKREGPVSAREAIEIAEEAVNGQVAGDYVEKIATPETRDGVEVWAIELVGQEQSATVVVDRATGEVLEVSIE